MPQKDYVKASRPKAKPTRGRATKGQGKTPAAKPWLLIAVTSMLVAGFVYFLWFLNQQKPLPAAVEPATTKNVKKDDLPAKPTEEPYQYIKELENKEVTVEVTQPAESQGPYQMQCGSFRAEHQAEAMKAQIAFVGFSSQIRRTEGSNGVWFRVVLGPYESKRKATADMNRLRQQNINTCRIWNWT